MAGLRVIQREKMDKALGHRREERRALALSYLINNLFEAKSLDECLDVAIKGLSMLNFFQSQISLLEDGSFVVKRNHMNKKYQFLLEKTAGRKFLGHKIDAKTSFISHLLDSKIVTTVDVRDAVKVELKDMIREYLPKEMGSSKRLSIVTRVASVIPKKMDLLMVPLNYQGKIIGAVGISNSPLERADIHFVKNLCELFAQAIEKAKTRVELVRLSNAVKVSTDSIVVSDLDAKIIDVNEATLKMYGTGDKEDLIGKNSFDLIAPEDRERALAGTKETLQKGYVKGREYNIVTKDGGRIPVEMSVAIMRDADGKPIGFVGISRDVSECKRTERMLLAS